MTNVVGNAGTIGEQGDLVHVFESVLRGARVERLGSARHPVFLAHFQWIATLESVEGEPFSIAIDSAGLDVNVQTARIKCAYEMLERFLSSAPGVFNGLIRENPGGDRSVIPWQAFTPYAQERLDELAAMRRNQFDRWCDAYGILTGQVYAVPASKVFPVWRHCVPKGAFDGECDASGLAAGPSRERSRCRMHGLCEVLERDALMLSWRISDWHVSDMKARDILTPYLSAFLLENGLRAKLIDVGDPGLAPVLLCLLSDRDGRVTCGSACSLDMKSAAHRSVLEAIMLWNATRGSISNNEFKDGAIFESRAHVLYGQARSEEVCRWFDSLPRRRPAVPPENLEALAERCRGQFFQAEPLVVDLKVRDEAIPEKYVCRLLQPHACRKEWASESPFMGGQRFMRFRETGQSINFRPHPFG